MIAPGPLGEWSGTFPDPVFGPPFVTGIGPPPRRCPVSSGTRSGPTAFEEISPLAGKVRPTLWVTPDASSLVLAMVTWHLGADRALGLSSFGLLIKHLSRCELATF